MSRNGLSDLDELVLSCRTPASRSYIREAVACYYAGAYKAAIVSTWTGVMYDLVDKIRELASGGDPAAQSKAKELERIVTSENYANNLAFEHSLLEFATRDLQLLSPTERKDFERLYFDRNRCAHLSIRADDQAFEPVPELSRYHIHNAVAHLLSKQPVQGKAALAYVFAQIDSITFPSFDPEAERYLKDGPMAAPRESLVRGVVSALVASLIQDDLSARSMWKRTAALNAINRMHRSVAEPALREKLQRVVERLDDDGYVNLFRFLHYARGTWNALSSVQQDKCARFLRESSEEVRMSVLPHALNIPKLRSQAEAVITQMPLEAVTDYLRTEPFVPESLIVDRAIDIYLGSKSFADVRTRGQRLLKPTVQFMDATQINKLIRGMIQNDQITFNIVFAQHLRWAFEASGTELADETNQAWSEVLEFIETEQQGDELLGDLRVRLGHVPF